MNVTDLRIAYRMDTGDYPLWAHNHDGRDLGWQQKSLQKGHPCTAYGEWLEEKLIKEKYLRSRYFQVKHEMPTSHFYGNNGYKEVLYGDYIEWLEGFLLKFYPQIVTKITNVS